MTIIKKRNVLQEYCDERDCRDCALNHVWTNDVWEHCINISDATDEELDRGLNIIRAENSNAVNHPSHYQGKHECIDEMIALFGVEAVKHFCMCNVHKYRYRAANKNGQEDLDKADWYMGKLMELEGVSDAAGARVP